MRVKVFSIICMLLLLFGFLASLTIQSVNAAPFYFVGVAVVGRNVVFYGENVSISISSNASQVLVEIYASDESLVYTGPTEANSTFTFQPPLIYGKFTLKASAGNNTCTTWFWLQNNENLYPFTVPYSWIYQGINYTLLGNYTLKATLNGQTLNADWLSEIFTKLKPTATLYRNDYGLIYVGTYGKDISSDNWLMNTFFGLKIRMNGTLASPTTLKWNFKAFNGEVLWRIAEMNIGALVYSFSDMDSRSVGCSYTLDKTGLKMNVYLQTSFDVDPTIHQSGFETGDFSEWTGTSGSGIYVQNNATYVYSGSYSMKNNDTGYVYKNITARDYAYARCYVNFVSFPYADYYAMNIIWFFPVYPATCGFHADVVYNETLGRVQWRIKDLHSGGNPENRSMEIVNTNQWYCVEVFFNNTSGSTQKLWLNGSLFLTLNSVMPHQTDQIRFGGHQLDAEGYYDNCVISDTYIGTEGVPNIGDFEAPSIVYSNKYVFINATISDEDGIADFVNATIGINGTVVLKWDNATNIFSKQSDANNYCTLNASGSVRTTSGPYAYKLSWKIKLYWNYSEGSIYIIDANTRVYDSAGNSRSGTNQTVFTFEPDLIVPSGSYNPSKPIVGQEFQLTGQLHYEGTSISVEDGTGITVYASRSGSSTEGNTTSVTAGQFAVSVTAPSTEGSYQWLLYSNTDAGVSTQNQTVTVYIHPSGTSPPVGSGPYSPTPSQVTFFGSATNLGILMQGQQINFDVSITWTGTNEITITNMTISGPNSWVLQPGTAYFPMLFFRGVGEENGTAVITLLMQVPQDASPSSYQLGLTFTVEAGVSTVTQLSCTTEFSVSATVSPSPTQPVQNIVAVLLVACLGIVLFGAVSKKKKHPV